ncbi:MAG: hypothetical protein GVY13_09205 [Alphaproteobacteria bacterium]|jgi:hypothetical protein|nr:hypothetical protein [Alphaproteobacteria bacterium]
MEPIVETFDADNAGWITAGDATTDQPMFVPAGGNPGGFIRAVDAGMDQFWFFETGDLFPGDRSGFIGGILSFDLRQNTTANQRDFTDVVLIGDGRLLAFDTATNPGTDWTSYEIELSADAGWRVGSIDGPAATPELFATVMGNLTALGIRGEYSVGADTGDLDNVALIPPDSLAAQARDVFRFFNTEALGHFFTIEASERDLVAQTLPRFNPEGTGFRALSHDSDAAEATDVFRFFNTQAGGHFFTTSPEERALVLDTLPQFRDEGVGFDAFDEPVPGTVPVFRFFNTEAGGHFFTTSVEERDLVQATLPQYNFEGIGFYAFPAELG